MSQRRGGSSKESEGVKSDEILPFSKTLDDPATSAGIRSVTKNHHRGSPALNSSHVHDGAVTSISIDERYRAENEQIRTKQWQESYYARGCTLSSWEAEYSQLTENGWKAECLKMTDGKDPNQVPCRCCSAIICSALGAGRVGNIAVLKQSNEWITEEVLDEENGRTITERSTRPRLDLVVGPYWPMLCMVTYPLILGVSTVTMITAIPKTNPLIALLWAICTIGLVIALGMTAFRDPGILPRYINPPPNQGENQWRWNDQALSYRPRGAWYDPDTAVIVEGFDHT